MDWKYILKTLSKNKVRAILTALGIIIGVWAVIVLIAIGNGLKKYIDDQFKSLGANSIYILPVANLENGGFGQRGFPNISFKEEDLDYLRLKLKDAESVLPMVSATSTITFQDKKAVPELVGSETGIQEALNLNVESGRFFNEAEEERGKKVAVLGSSVKDKLFNTGEAIGQKIKLNDQIFLVIGVIEKKGGASIGSGVDDHCYIPYKAAWKLTEKKEFQTILVKAKTKESVESLKVQAKAALMKKYTEDDFSVVDQTQILSIINNVLNVFTVALAGIAAISLIVGGVGIMNVMYISVRERTREIGLRKAVGATNGDILSQFLAESVILSVGGGIIGLLFAILITFIINRFFPAVITLWSVILALGVSITVGIIFGIAPAKSASKLSPVEALRYE